MKSRFLTDYAPKVLGESTDQKSFDLTKTSSTIIKSLDKESNVAKGITCHFKILQLTKFFRSLKVQFQTNQEAIPAIKDSLAEQQRLGGFIVHNLCEKLKKVRCSVFLSNFLLSIYSEMPVDLKSLSNAQHGFR